MNPVLIDAGPLVALVNQDDQWYEACSEALLEIRDPLLTVWPVLTEAMYLLGRYRTGQESLFMFLEGGGVSLARLDFSDLSRVRELMESYRNLPMDLADAALVRVAERERIRRIFTIDRRGFQVYRPAGIRHLQLIP